MKSYVLALFIPLMATDSNQGYCIHHRLAWERDPMPTQPAATPEALDALIAASLQSRREALMRSARRQRIATRVAFSCSGCITLLALAAFFLARDPDAGAILTTMALVTLTFAYLAGKANQKKLAERTTLVGGTGDAH